MIELAVIAGCLVVNGALAAYEMAFVSFSKAELKRLAKQNIKDASFLLYRRENPERTLSIIQIGITLMGALAATVGGVSAAENIEPYFNEKLGLYGWGAEALAVITIVFPLTYVSVVLGELVPKALALRHPTAIALGGARLVFIADKLLSPLVSFLAWSTAMLVQLILPKLKGPAAPAQETLVDIEVLSPIHRQYIVNLARIENKSITDMMLTWNDVEYVTRVDSIDELASTILSTGHTRLPVLDEEHRVVGILNTKELLAYRESGGRDWATLVRQALRVRGQDSALGALRLMQQHRSHMAIVYSAQGERTGIITLEDIIEEIVGDISDEDDDGRIQKLLAARARIKSP